MGGERSHHYGCAIPTPRFPLFNRIILDAFSLHLCISLFYSRNANFDFFLEPPKLIPKGSLSIEIVEGMILYMDAKVGGYPVPLVTWSHNEVTLQELKHAQSETSLIIHSFTADKKGRYTCFAINELGNTSFTVDVKGRGIDFIPGQASFVRVDVACQERETQGKFAVFGLLLFFLMFFELFVCFSFCFARLFSLFFFCFVLFGFVFFFLSKLAVLGKSLIPPHINDHTDLGQLVTTTATLGRLFRSFTFPETNELSAFSPRKHIFVRLPLNYAVTTFVFLRASCIDA